MKRESIRDSHWKILEKLGYHPSDLVYIFKDMVEKIINDKGISYERYTDYLLAPAVVLELLSRGKNDSEIRIF